MNCDVPEEKLWSWIDQNSPELDRHTSRCPHCRRVADRLRSDIAAARGRNEPLWPALPERIGSYRILEFLGEGGQGLVYSAEQQTPRRTVALKVLKGGRFVHEYELRHFEREVQTLGALHHPGIATIYEAGLTEEGLHFFAMELVRGSPLTAYVSVAQPDLRSLLELFCKICDAVAYAHEQGVVHRDLKPGNILIDADSNPHILDFGLARLTDADLTRATAVTQSGQIVGTLRYMSPEQARGNSSAIDVRSDVYSLGVILYELVARQAPYEIGACPAEALAVICETPPRRPSTIMRGLRGELETIILKALEKEPQRRYPSVADLSDDLQRYLANEPILAKPPSGFYILRKKLSKHRAHVGFAAAALALGAVGLCGGVWFSRHAARQEREHQQAVTLAQRQQQVNRGRLKAVQLLWRLEICQIHRLAHHVQCAHELLAEFPDLLEAKLVWLQARFRQARNAGGQRDLSDVIAAAQREASGPSAWLFCGMLAEMHGAGGHDREMQQWQARSDRDAPDTAEGWFLRSLATVDRDTAIARARTAIERDALHVLAWERLAYLYVQAADFQRALNCGQQLKTLASDPAAWDEFQAHVMLRQGRYREAIDGLSLLIAAAQKPSQTGDLHFRRAVAHLCLKNYAAALADYDRSLELSRNPWVRRQRATVLWILGQGELAAANYRQFGESLGVDYANVRLFLVESDLARRLHHNGQAAEAAQLRQRAREEFDAVRLRSSSPWLECISLCVAGLITPAELLARADRDDERRCEAFYYGGERYLLDNDLENARKFFRQCVDLQMPVDPDVFPPDPMNEYHLASWRLAQLDAATQSTFTSIQTPDPADQPNPELPARSH